MLVHGGMTEDYSKNTNKRHLASVVEVFDAYTESWKQTNVAGEAPAPGVYSAASASAEDDLFTFGGSDGSGFFNALHKLTHKPNGSSQWSKIELCPPSKSPGSPMAKEGAGMVAFGDKLAVMGGYGVPHGPTQAGSSFIRDTRPKAPDGGGWTNEFHICNLTVRNGTYISRKLLYYNLNSNALMQRSSHIILIQYSHPIIL